MAIAKAKVEIYDSLTAQYDAAMATAKTSTAEKLGRRPKIMRNS
jgi:hypothetical protein